MLTAQQQSDFGRLGQALRNRLLGRSNQPQQETPKRPPLPPGSHYSRGASQTPPPPPERTPESYFGDIDAQGNVTTPDVAGMANEYLPDIQQAEQTEIERAEGALAGTRGRIGAREARMEADITGAGAAADRATGAVTRIAEEGKEDVAGLPGRVQADVEGIADKYKKQTDVDIGKIESLGREAVGMAVEGKNAAAQAAVQAQQASVQAAVSQINADPSIPQSRKTAMIAQIRTQSSMQIASTVGANIKDFTAMQTGAMTATMQTVGAAMTARNQSLAALGGAEINAVASAHETAAGISKGYDDMAAGARANREQLRFQYQTLRESVREAGNATDLQLLGEDQYVGGMPVDFKMMDMAMLRDMMGTDFSMQLQGAGYEMTREAMGESQRAARSASFGAIAQVLPAPWNWILMGVGQIGSMFGSGGPNTGAMGAGQNTGIGNLFGF